MKHRYTLIILFALAIANIGNFNFAQNSNVLGITTVEKKALAATTNKVQVKTETAFDQKEEKIYEPVPYKIEYVEDDEMEYGTEEIVEPGIDGTKTYTYLITFWFDEEIDRQLTNTELEEPKPEIVAKGTKVIWREYMTPDVGGVWYWHKLRVWATKYDANCYGCTGRTFSGTEVKKGVCAVDPNVIPLGTNFYVDGYGLCRAEDIGGAIKGNDVDLGFKDVSKADWRTSYTDIYLLTNSPTPR